MKLSFRFLWCILVTVRFVLLLPSKWSVRKTMFCTTHVISGEEMSPWWRCWVER